MGDVDCNPGRCGYEFVAKWSRSGKSDAQKGSELATEGTENTEEDKRPTEKESFQSVFL